MRLETQPPTHATIGARLRVARAGAHLSQRQLAARLSVSAAAVAHWETGGSQPATERLGAIATVLDVSVDWLVGKSTDPDRSDQRLTEDRRLLDEGRRLGVDFRAVVSEARQRNWLTENRGAIEDANAFLDRHGLWSDGKRLF